MAKAWLAVAGSHLGGHDFAPAQTNSQQHIHAVSRSAQNSISVPTMKPFGGFSMLTAVVVLIAGCSEPDQRAEPTGDAETAPPVSAATPSEEVSAKTSECEDKRGDGGPMDLVSASIRTSDSVLVAVELAAPLPRNDTVSVGVLAQSRDYDVSLLVGTWGQRARSRALRQQGASRQSGRPSAVRDSCER